MDAFMCFELHEWSSCFALGENGLTECGTAVKTNTLNLKDKNQSRFWTGFVTPCSNGECLNQGVEFLIQWFCILCFKLGFPRSLVTQIGCGISHVSQSRWGYAATQTSATFRSQKNLRHAMSTFPWRMAGMADRMAFSSNPCDCMVTRWLFVSFAQLSISKLFHQEKENFQTNCLCVCHGHGYSDGCTNSNGSDVSSIEENLLLDVRMKKYLDCLQKNSFPSFHLC